MVLLSGIIKMVEYVCYTLNNKNEWGSYGGWNPQNKKVPIPLPLISDLKFAENDKTYLTMNGIKKQVTIDGFYIYYVFNKPELGWEIYYDLKWTGTGHTHGYKRYEDIK